MIWRPNNFFVDNAKKPMFVFIHKKVAIPNNVELNCVSWNGIQGWIACGGEAGFLKVLKVESKPDPDPKNRGIASPIELTMRQNLEGHKDRIHCVAWNERHKKLTSSDDTGLIIVWSLDKNIWFEEMINNRKQSVVKDLKWNFEGLNICIAYEDGTTCIVSNFLSLGMVIVGSVDGNRVWGKEVKQSLSMVEWSPDGSLLLFATMAGDVFVYDAKMGNEMVSII